MFAIELPAAQTAVANESPSLIFSSGQLRIAVVEDNLHVLDAMVLALESAGHQVIGATSGQALFDQLENQVPDFIVTDYRLTEGETGFDVIANVRNVFANDVPAIIITGDTDPMLVRGMADRGIAVQYKPLQIDQLLSAIAGISGRKTPGDTST